MAGLGRLTAAEPARLPPAGPLTMLVCRGSEFW
jgi:hypothetical protein